MQKKEKKKEAKINFQVTFISNKHWENVLCVKTMLTSLS